MKFNVILRWTFLCVPQFWMHFLIFHLHINWKFFSFLIVVLKLNFFLCPSWLLWSTTFVNCQKLNFECNVRLYVVINLFVSTKFYFLFLHLYYLWIYNVQKARIWLSLPFFPFSKLWHPLSLWWTPKCMWQMNRIRSQFYSTCKG